MKTIKNVILFFIVTLTMYSCSSPKLGKNQLDLEKFDLNFDVAAFYADEIEKVRKNEEELDRDKRKRKIEELLALRLIDTDTVFKGEFMEEKTPVANQYNMRSYNRNDSLAYFQKMHFYKINMATSLKGDFMALVAKSESKGTDDFEALRHYLEQKHGKPTLKDDKMYRGLITYHWELDDRLLAISFIHDNEENVLKLGIEITEDGVKADTTKQPTHVTHLLILKNQYKQDNIIGDFIRGDWSDFNRILEK
ncbi:hypothetical protein ACILE9_05620 [Capnocytophaga cynodegmi]|uniref:hypothetical protein n=1 Tax=Capnocytophaga cynodegmi TaxID=28189 RepID=UPI0037CD7C70